ncbi:MAG: hypothetical protein KF861_06230, partial [Planctomycetaceae bacterium]|nr:hypothetical protein [Planctomycetaceae bacterium]
MPQFPFRQTTHQIVLTALSLSLLPSTVAGAADLEKAHRLASAGQYEDALHETDAALQGNVYFDRWHLLKAEMELTLGRWDDARATVEQGLSRHTFSIRLRWLARDAFRRTNQADSA